MYWQPLSVILAVIQERLAKVPSFDLSCARKMRCKYLRLNIDMRDGHATLCSDDGDRISFDQLRYQYGKPETGWKPEDE